MRIVVDVMGGDHGPGVVIEGVRDALAAYSEVKQLFLVGQQAEIEPLLKAHGLNDSRISVVHASEVLAMTDKPVEGIRKKKDCSLLRAVEVVKDGKADAVISLGNTGGLVAASTIRLRTIEGVERPAIVTVMPTAESEFVMADVGANPEAKPIHLVHSAVMGAVYSQKILKRSNPRVGIISNGSEEMKGTELTRETLKLCQRLDLNFIGYVEGSDLFANNVDVAVTDGFTGNILLKTIEGMGKTFSRILETQLKANPLRMIGAGIASGAFKTIKRRMNPDNYGGAPLLGLNGIVIKAHGSAKPRAIMNAIRVAGEFVQNDVSALLRQNIARANERLASDAAA